MSIYSTKLAASIPDYLCISSLALAILFTAIAAGVSLITNALDELKNLGLSQASTSQSLGISFLLVICLVEYLDTLNSRLLQLDQR
ncbi:hypothetical protein [Nostoc sp.]|uniref:hypothetical protein n=1 Tax=Nostoc sp. TaxID=1180 RepID=UPI002FFA2934